MSKIVVGFIDTPEGHRALDLAIDEARRRDATLVVIHSLLGRHRTQSAEILHYREALEAVTDRLSQLGIDHESHDYVRGNTPAEDLLHAADEFGAELIVIGYRRRSSMQKALLGSHAHDILMGANCPVLAIVAPNE